MTEKQKDRLAIYREFGNKATEAYNFIFAEDSVDTHKEKPELVDGVYYVYSDKSTELYTGQYPSREVEYIGVKQGNRSVAVALNDIEGGDELNLFNKDANLPEHSDFYTKVTDINVAEDFCGEANTEFIIEKGSPIPFAEDGEYIPSAGECILISSYLKQVNGALSKAGGQRLSRLHWTSTLNSPDSVWIFNFFDGSLNVVCSKILLYPVRTVIAFPR